MASKRRLRRRACANKVRYPTAQDAIQAKRNIKLRTGHADLHTYKCQFCGGHHIGHLPSRMQSALRAKYG